MAKYRKKPIIIDAIQYNGQNLNLVMDFIGDPDGTSGEYFVCHNTGGIAIPTLEGTMIASLNDYIIKGIKGEFYPCKPDIFENSYDRVDEPA